MASMALEELFENGRTEQHMDGRWTKSDQYSSSWAQLSWAKQEAHGPRVAHLSDIATAYMQMLCNIFPILSSQLMKRSSFKQFLILKKNIYDMPVNGVWSLNKL